MEDEQWWKNPNSIKDFVLPDGKKLRQATLDMFQLTS